MIEITLNNYIDIPAIRAVENKLLMFSGHHRMVMITKVSITSEEVTYGRKMNKTKTVKTLRCTVHGWNQDGDFVGSYDQETSKRYLEYDLLGMRKNYLEFKKQWDAMHKLSTALNNPLQTLENPVKELDHEVLEEITRCLQEDKPLLAVKLYKVATGKSLVESKEYIKSLTI